MKTPATLLFLFIALQTTAQYTSFFKEDFDSNNNHWFTGEVKKSTVQLQEGHYAVYNDEGKSPIVSLIDLPFDEHKNYTIESNITEAYISDPDGGGYGIMFAAKDEKNGYAVLLNQWSFFRFVKITNGKIEELHMNVNKDSKGDSHHLKIILEDWQWKFLVDDKTLYACKPLPWMGHKAGFYSSGLSGYTADNLEITEATPLPNVCPLPFTQDKFREQFSKIVCAATDGFAGVQGTNPQRVHSDSVWVQPVLPVDGAKSLTVIRVKGAKKQYMVAFLCADSMSRESSTRMFDEIALAINEAHPSCLSLKQDDTSDDVNDKLQKSVIWTSDKSGSIAQAELDLHSTFGYYEIVIHVYGMR